MNPIFKKSRRVIFFMRKLLEPQTRGRNSPPRTTTYRMKKMPTTTRMEARVTVVRLRKRGINRSKRGNDLPHHVFDPDEVKAEFPLEEQMGHFLGLGMGDQEDQNVAQNQEEVDEDHGRQDLRPDRIPGPG